MLLAFCSVFLVLSLIYNAYLLSKVYPRKFDGSIIVTQNEAGKRLFSLEIDTDPDEIEKMDKVLFSVQNNWFVE